jgi:Sec-independent protein translocase protein TatA
VWSWNRAGWIELAVVAVVAAALLFSALRRAWRSLAATTDRIRQSSDAVVAGAESLTALSRSLEAIAEELRRRREQDASVQARRVGFSKGEVFTGEASSGVGGIAMVIVSNFSSEIIHDLRVTLLVAGRDDPDPQQQSADMLEPGQILKLAFLLNTRDGSSQTDREFSLLFTDAWGRPWRRLTSDPVPHRADDEGEPDDLV